MRRMAEEKTGSLEKGCDILHQSRRNFLPFLLSQTVSDGGDKRRYPLNKFVSGVFVLLDSLGTPDG